MKVGRGARTRWPPNGVLESSLRFAACLEPTDHHLRSWHHLATFGTWARQWPRWQHSPAAGATGATWANLARRGCRFLRGSQAFAPAPRGGLIGRGHVWNPATL